MSVPTAPATASTRGFGSVKEGRLMSGSRASLLLTLTTPPTSARSWSSENPAVLVRGGLRARPRRPLSSCHPHPAPGAVGTAQPAHAGLQPAAWRKCPQSWSSEVDLRKADLGRDGQGN